MKFLFMIIGLNNATANYSCLRCLIHKDRWDTSKPLNFCNEDKLQRTLDWIKTSVTSNEYGCINPPLLDTPLNHIITDELHLLLRMIDGQTS